MSTQFPNLVPVRNEGEPTEDLDIAQHLGTLWAARWLIVAATGGATALALAYSVLATPEYQTDALLQVEEKTQGVAGVSELTSLFTGQTPAEAEIEILKSRSLVGAVVTQLKLDIEVLPRRFPIVGAAFARRHSPDDGIRSAILGFNEFAWGGERLTIDLLECRRCFEADLTLRALGDGEFVIEDDSGPLLVGRVGEQGRTEELRIFVSDLTARPGTEFRVRKRSHSDVVRDLQRRLQILERGKKTGVLQLTLQGSDPSRITRTLDAITRAYLRQNVDRKSEEAERTLEFLNTQLPDLKNQLNIAEAALEEFRAKQGSGTVNLTLEAQAALDQIVEVEKRLSEMELQRADLRRRFTENHPVVGSIQRQILELEASRASLNAKLKDLPKAELEIARLMRDVRVADELYLLLLNKAQELKILKSGTIGNVRILDSALLPDKPIAPKKGLTTLIGLVAGLGMGVAFALVRRGFSQGVEDPEAIERLTAVSVYANVLHSAAQTAHEREGKRRRRVSVPILAETDPNDIVVESIRSLRTSVQFALSQTKRNIIAIGGPSPNIGKSFVSVNLAYVLAGTGKAVLLVDGDMRRGKLNRYFDVARGPGLSDVVLGAAPIDSALRTTSNPALTFLASGEFPPNPSELLLSDRFSVLLDDLCARFELVIIDCPPILAVTDGALIGRKAGVNLMVLRSGMHPPREIQTAMRSFQHNGVKLSGIVLNDIRARDGFGGGVGAYSYHYDYRPSPKDDTSDAPDNVSRLPKSARS